MKTFADRLRETRQKKQLSQEKLAKACGIAQGTIGNYETQVREKPEPDILFCIARELGVSAEWLMEGTTPNYALPYSHSTGTSTREEAVCNEGTDWPFPRIAPSAYRALSENDRQLVENAVISLMESLTRQKTGEP